VDVVQFDRAHRLGSAGNAEGTEASLRQIVDLYTGPLLEGCLEPWVFPERTTREQACLTALQTLADRAEQRRDYTEALGFLHRAREMDGLRDTIWRSLMRVLSASGDTPAALSAYREYRLLLREQMNIEPDQETIQLYQQIRQQPPKTDAPRRDAAKQEASSAPASSPENLSLPTPLTALIGREQETRAIQEAVSRSRLVTLVGGGGIGKTRLAIHVARELASRGEREVSFVELAALKDPLLLPSFVATSLGIREESTPDPTAVVRALTGWFAARPVLLVLDNGEHLIDALASLVQTVLDRCPDLHILITSRQRLGLTGEITWRVPSLPTPDVTQLPADPADAVATALTYPAIQMFVERAAAVSAAFQLTHREEVVAVCQICQRLDGIPLAIELAAARVRSLSVDDIHARLDQRFRLLTGGSRVALPRQQTLKSLIDWSYDLLNEAEKALLCRLSVFSGSWTLEAAETVCAGDPLEDWEILDLLTGLIDKSLVVAEPASVHVRYRLLETIRQYASDRLREAGNEMIWRERHLAYFLALAEEAEAEASKGTVGQMAVIARLAEEQDNLRTALEASLAFPSGTAALRLCAALQSFWRTRGYYTEGREWCARALSALEARTLERAKALTTVGILANLQGDFAAALSYHKESLDIFQEFGYTRGIASALHGLGNVTSNQGDYAAARTYYEESLALQREIGDQSGIGAALHNLGNVVRNQGDYASARAYFEECLPIFREIGHRQFLSNALNNLGRMATLLGDFHRAETHYHEGLALARETGNRSGIALSLIFLGNLAHSLNDPARAQVYYEESLDLYREIADRSGIGAALNNLGGAAYQVGDYDRARAYYEESLPIFREIGHRQFLTISLHGLGNVAVAQGHHDRARLYYEECLQLQQEIGDRHGIAASLEAFANLAIQNNRPKLAVVLWGAAETLRVEIGASLSPAERPRYDRLASEIRIALADSDAFDAAVQEGSALTMEQAIEVALKADKSD
jgi:predicted ATPase/Tfp pilus assembly protein PilF